MKGFCWSLMEKKMLEHRNCWLNSVNMESNIARLGFVFYVRKMMASVCVQAIGIDFCI